VLSFTNNWINALMAALPWVGKWPQVAMILATGR
jgi:hypothetical protein